MTDERGGPRHLEPRHALILALIVESADWGRQERFLVRQEPAVEVRGFLARVPDLRGERDTRLHGVTARWESIQIICGERSARHAPLSRLRWDAAGIAYTAQAWGLAEDRLLRVAASLRPLDDDHAAEEPQDWP